MACRGCGGQAPSAGSSGQAAVMAQRSAAQGAQFSMNDSDFEMARYLHPNRGQHPVYGGSVDQNGRHRFYGFRAGGGQETFLVHRADIAAQPHYFQVVSVMPAPPLQPVAPPPPPVLITQPRPVVVREQTMEEAMVEMPDIPPPELILERTIEEKRFDLQALPGVTPAIAKGLSDAGLGSAEAILGAGIEGLQDIKWVGGMKAQLIYKWVKENYG